MTDVLFVALVNIRFNVCQDDFNDVYFEMSGTVQVVLLFPTLSMTPTVRRSIENIWHYYLHRLASYMFYVSLIH